jgi:alpha/beta superfamily hydrolase
VSLTLSVFHLERRGRVLRALILGPLQKYTYHVLSYNCRGVGKSTGSASYTGLSEAQDLEDMVKWALETITTEVDSLVIIVSKTVQNGGH